MHFTVKYSIIVSILIKLACCSSAGDTNVSQRPPKMLFTVMRHGARAPITLIPGDPNNNKWLTIGLSELTNLGKRQQIINGKLCRLIYNKFLGLQYNASTFHIQSSNFNRCVTSGQAFTTGLFPPTGDQIWTKKGCLGHSWQPIPVFTTNIANSDDLNAFFKEQCFRVLGYSNIYSKYKKLIDDIANVTGLQVSNSTMFSIVLFADALICEVYEDLPFPHGLTIHKEQLFRFWSEIFDFAVTNSKPKISAILLNDMVNRINSFYNGSSLVKMNVYSLSDLHIASLMAAITNTTVGGPPFTASVYLELHKANDDVNNDYFIVRYRPQLAAEFKSYFIKDCGYQCKYDQFINMVNKIIANANS